MDRGPCVPTKLGDSGFATASREGADDAELESLQFIFAPAHRSRTDSDTADGTDGTLAENFTGNGGSALGKIRSTGVKYDVPHPR